MAGANGSPVIEGEVVDGDVTSMIEGASRMLAQRGGRTEPRQALVPAPAPTPTVAPQVKAADLVARLNMIKEAMETAMVLGVDYGIVPGTEKPALFKPGAEKLSVMFQLDIQLVADKSWGPGEHLTVESHATVFHQVTQARLGYGEGLCTSREKKYAKRQAQRECPHCKAKAVIKGRDEYGGGWLCFRKKGGCGSLWPDGAREIEGQQVGEIENPELPDTWNTVVKIGNKRARVDAVLAVTGASAIFTQDLDDGQGDDPPPQTAPVPRQQAQPPAPRRLDELPENERQARSETIACANEIVARGIWDERRRSAEFVIHKAADTSSVEVAVMSMPPGQVDRLRHRMTDLLAEAEGRS